MVYWDDAGQSWLVPPTLMGDQESEGWKKFREYDQTHPNIWSEFERQSLDAASRGFTRIGAHFIIQIMRWETGATADGDKFKIGNNYFPYYARKFLNKHPECQGFFELRTLKRA